MTTGVVLTGSRAGSQVQIPLPHPGSEKSPHPLLQQRDQFRLHEVVVVGDVEADDALVLQPAAQAAPEPGAVGALHDEDEVCPVEVVGRHRLLRIGRQAGGGGLDAGTAGEDPLGRGGAEAVAGAEEEEFGQLNRSNRKRLSAC
jgi:hypothetical protein